MSEGPQRTRMADVAESLGLSVSTISLAFRDSPLIASTTRAAVRKEAQRLGYVYNRGAANLRRSTSELVGLVVPDIRNEFAAEVALGLQEVLESDGLFVALANTGDDLGRQGEILQSLREQRVEGIVLIPALHSQPHDVELSDVQVVLMNRAIEGSRLQYIGVDEFALVKVATDHLFLRHRVESASYFGGIREASGRIARAAAFHELAVETGVAMSAPWMTATPRTAHGAYEVAAGLLQSTPPPNGLLCHSDEIAWGVLRALREAGYGPEDCRVIGIDDLPVSSVFSPSVTSVALQPRQLGREAGAALRGTLHASPARIPQLNIRESCGCRNDAMTLPGQ